MTAHKSFRPARLFISVFSLGLSGCLARTVDLQAIQNFDKTTTAASTSFQDVSSDYYASCLKYQEYRSETRLGTRPLTARPVRAAIEPMPMLEPASVSNTTDAPVEAPNEMTLAVIATGGGDRDCALSKLLSERWSLENNVLVGYVQALGDIAGVATAPDKTSFESLGLALKGASVLRSDDTAKAGGDAAAAIAGSFIRHKQERDLVGLASDTKATIDTLTDGLQSNALAYRVIVRDELSQLDSSRIALIAAETAHLRTLRQRAGLPKDSQPDDAIPGNLTEVEVQRRAAILHVPTSEERSLLAEELELRDRIGQQRLRWSAEASDAVRRANMAAEYYKAIAAIRKTHDALVAAHGGLNAVVATIRPFADELSEPVSALITASAKAK